MCKLLLEMFLPINSLSNVSYSGYRNHVQNYTLQERENSDHVTNKDNMSIYGLGGETEQHPELIQPQIRKSWDSMENANKKRK